MRKTKIIATLGPATNSYDKMIALIKAGMNAARVNFSHGTHAEHQARITLLNKAAKDMGVYIPIMQDLQGPKIRTGRLKDHGPINGRF